MDLTKAEKEAAEQRYQTKLRAESRRSGRKHKDWMPMGTCVGDPGFVEPEFHEPESSAQTTESGSDLDRAEPEDQHAEAGETLEEENTGAATDAGIQDLGSEDVVRLSIGATYNEDVNGVPQSVTLRGETFSIPMTKDDFMGDQESFFLFFLEE